MRKKLDSPTLTPKKHSPRQPISITIEPDVLAWVDERADNRSEQINGDLTRYYRLLAETRRTLRERFSGPEISLILDACNGWWILSPEDCRSIWHNVEDAIRLDRIDAKWEVGQPADLVERLRQLSWLESIALCDAIERFWHAVGEGDHARETASALE